MKIIQFHFLVLPAVVSAMRPRRDNNNKGKRLGNRNRQNGSPVVNKVCGVLNDNFDGGSDGTCNCNQDLFNSIDFNCDFPVLEKEFGNGMEFDGQFILNGSFDYTLLQRTYEFGLETCFNGNMALSDGSGFDMKGCASAKVRPSDDGEPSIFECGGSINDNECKCVTCPDGETGIVFDCGLSSEISICFPARELP